MRCMYHPKRAIQHIAETCTELDWEDLFTGGGLHDRASIYPKGSYLMNENTTGHAWNACRSVQYAKGLLINEMGSTYIHTCMHSQVYTEICMYACEYVFLSTQTSAYVCTIVYSCIPSRCYACIHAWEQVSVHAHLQILHLREGWPRTCLPTCLSASMFHAGKQLLSKMKTAGAFKSAFGMGVKKASPLKSPYACISVECADELI